MPRHPDALPLSRRTEAALRYTPAEQEQFRHWQHLVDARLIGNIAKFSAETLARHAANEVALGLRPRIGGAR